jgi:hypothetical protein
MAVACRLQPALGMRMMHFALCAVLVAGCATEELDDDELLEGEGDGKADGAALSLAPSYALELTSSMRTEDRRESDPSKRYATLSLRARAHVKVTQSGRDVRLAVKLCDVRLPRVSGYQPELAANFVASLPPLEVTAAIERGPRELVSQPVALVLGAALPSPLTDALPAATSSRVRDQDQDGHPGVSISIPGYGSIFAALRVKLAFAAPLTSASTITGAADVTLDQKIYGDNIWFYDAAASAAAAEANVRVVSSSNRVTLKRDATTCAKVRSLFP